MSHPTIEEEQQIDNSDTTSVATRAERLLALRAPLIERGKRVPALERSIAAYQVETKALYELLCTSQTAEEILTAERDEALRDTETAKLQTDLLRERLRTAEAQLAEVRDLAHIKHVAHSEEVHTLQKRCSALKRKIDYLTTSAKRDSENKINELEHAADDLRKELLDLTNERDEWRETALSTEQQLKEMKPKLSKVHSLSALLETERTLCATLRKKLKDAEKTVQRENTKSNVKNSGKEKVEKALETEKGKTAELRQKLKDADVSAKKTKREEAKLRQKCDDLEKRLNEALTRAVKSEERAAELESKSATGLRGAGSAAQAALMSPAPLAFGKRMAEDVASESRSRFTATLPQGIRDDGSIRDDETGEPSPSPRKMKSSTRSKRKNAKPQKLAPPRKTVAKGSAKSRTNADSESLKEPETKKRRRPASAKESNGPVIEVESTTNSPAPVSISPPGMVTPRRKHGKATRKTTASSPAKRQREPPPEESDSTEVPRRTLRSRRPVSYNYDVAGRDVVNAEPGFEVDYEALQPAKVRMTRSTRSKRPEAAARQELSESTRSDRVVSSSSGKRRRVETVRKQVPTTRDRVK